MMKRKRRTHSPEFKSKVALAAIKGDLTMAEMVKKYDVHANQITEWKKQLLSGAPDVFGKGARKAEDAEEVVQALHAKIGQLTMENDFYNAGSNGFTGPEERNGRPDGTVASDSPVRASGSATLDVLSHAEAGIRGGA